MVFNKIQKIISLCISLGISLFFMYIYIYFSFLHLLNLHLNGVWFCCRKSCFNYFFYAIFTCITFFMRFGVIMFLFGSVSSIIRLKNFDKVRSDLPWSKYRVEMCQFSRISMIIRNVVSLGKKFSQEYWDPPFIPLSFHFWFRKRFICYFGTRIFKGMI